ncbi:hypothetical protein INT47_012698 [Mucor saturninus]|uniref:Zinc finger protein 865 n=1 Tax=Mucor saturninus TaxID=64648 RepID=A0A8H7V1J7_9FUNG|nr:hypothetical protein INT47_012698 [Mucor saturninus]
MMTMTNGQSTSPTLSSLLNKGNKVDTGMKEYLPTPVTPASDFSQFHNIKKDTSAYSTFSVIKPPPSPTTPTTTLSRSSNNNDVKPYPCPECHQTFSRPHNLKSHLTTHSSERPFQCDVCNHHFRRHHDLKRHQKLHTGERPYVCKDCYRSFARLDALNRHRRAEGGTACSAVHQQVKQELQVKSATTTTTTNTTTSSNSSTSSPPPQQQQQQQQQMQQQQQQQQQQQPIQQQQQQKSPQQGGRPVIPQLHIPHPASHLYPKESNFQNSPIPPSSSQLGQLLPSPSALSSLPIATNNNLTPIYTPSSPPPSSSSSSQPQKTKTTGKSPLYHPYQQWSPYSRNERPTLPPLSASPPPPNYHHASPKGGNTMDRLMQENDELKRDINQIRSMAQKEAASLKSRLHDLEVENKVLRSLIHNPKNSEKSSCSFA